MGLVRGLASIILAIAVLTLIALFGQVPRLRCPPYPPPSGALPVLTDGW